jgi:hypothetical protein
MMERYRDRALLVLTALGAIFFLVFGIWAAIGAKSFYDNFAEFPPFNAHFLHDVGAFQIGIAATLVLALWKRTDAIFVALGGAGIGAAAHVVAHIKDHDLGGSDSDTVALAVVAVLLILGAGWRLLPRPV